MLKQILTFALLLTTTYLFSQGGVGGVAINNANATPDNSAMLDVSSSNKGVLVPRVALTGIADATTIASPATSLLVYNTATAGTIPTDVTPGFYYWDGTQWLRFVAGNIVGTDDQDLTGATLTGLTLQTDIENGASVSVDLSPIADSAFTQILNNADTLFSNTTFTDSLLSFIYNNGDTLLSNTTFITNLGDSLFLSQNFLDSIASVIYNRSDTLLSNASFLGVLSDSIDSDIDSVKLTGTTLTIYENGMGYPVDVSSLQDGVNDADNDPTNEIELPATATTNQVLTWNGAAWVAQTPGAGADNWGAQTVVTGAGLSGNGTSGSPLVSTFTEVDGVIGNEYNTGMTVSGGNLNVTDGGGTFSVPLSSLGDGTGTDNQTLSISGNTLTISGGNNVTLTDNVNDADFDPTNELQTISETGSTVTLSNGGGSFTDTDTQLTEAQVDAYTNNNGYLTSFTEVDGSVTNELQTISLTGSTATLSNGGGSISINDADNDPTNEYNTAMSLNSTTRVLSVQDNGSTKTADFNSLLDCYVFYKRVYMPSATTQYLINLPWVELKTNGTNGQIFLENTSGSFLSYSYSINNGASVSNTFLPAGNSVTITVVPGNMIKVLLSTGLNSYASFDGYNSGQGHMRGTIMIH